MSLDLEHLYETMGAQADRVALPPLESIHRRARRHRTLMFTATAVPVVAALTTLAVVWSILAPPPQNLAGQGFLKFDGAAPPVLPYGVTVNDAMTLIHGNTVYARWSDIDNQEHLAALDLGTLRPLWGPITMGRFGGIHEIWVSRGAILAAGTQGSIADQLVALDPATGQIRWRHDFNFEFDRLLLYDDVAVLSLTETKDIAALDLRTGAKRWASGWTTPPLGITSMRRSDEFTELGGYGNRPIPADRRFVTHQADGTIQVREVDSGQLLSNRVGGAGPVSAEVTFDGRLYFASPYGVTQVDLEGGGSRRIYTGEAHRLAPCGSSLLCVLSDELVAIDAVSGREVWRAPAMWTMGDIFATAAAIRVPADSGYAVYDLTGKRLLTIDGDAHWADDEHLLVWKRGSTANDNSVSAVSVLTGERAVLGRAEWNFCSWTKTMLACPTERGISVWRYRANE